MTVYRRGSKGEEVKKLQAQLKGLDHLTGSIDGDYGPGTEAAVRAFQEANGLEADGIVGPNTWARLFPPAPSRPVSAVYRLGSKGQEVRRLQERLIELGHYRGPVDGDFGGGTLAAVRAFQSAANLQVDGVVGPATWRAIFEEEIPEPEIVSKPLNERCLALTGTFEIGKPHPEYFAGLSGDFDRQGMSFGVLQWNFGQNSLQPLLRETIATHRELVREIFHVHFDTLVEVLEGDKDDQMEFARSIENSDRHYVEQPWKGMFKALGRSQECQAIQVKYADVLYQAAIQLCRDYDLWSERAVALMFDIKVQNGRIRVAAEAQIRTDFTELPDHLSEVEREVDMMRIVANRRAEASYARWVEDVRKRKLCCANGEGTVHGVPFRLEEQFGIGLEPF